MDLNKTSVAVFKESFWGPNGFEELRKYIKQGSDFSKELVYILQERAELEVTYAKGLQKLANRLNKSSKELIGTSAYAWQEVSVAMESEAELHKNLSIGLQEDITKQLKILVESQHKTRKQIETSVEKATRNLNDRRSDEHKIKKQSYTCAKENEKIKDSLADSRSDTRSLRSTKSLSEKELSKLEQKRKKTEDHLQKSDQDYFSVSLKAERARQDWDLVVLKAEEQFQVLEEERLSRLQDFVEKYSNHLSQIGPKLIEDSGRLTEAIAIFDVQGDLITAIDIKGTGPNVPEQLLPDFYAEDLNNAMNKDRRKEFLEKYLQIVSQALELEKKGQQGIRTLSRGLSSHFNDTTTNQQELATEMLHMEATQNFLEAFQYKVHCTIADLESRSRPQNPLSVYMEQYRDKQGFSHNVLKVPPWSGLQGNFALEETPAPVTFQAHRRNPSDIRDAPQIAMQGNECQTIGRCRALYVYDGNDGDELTIRPGDIITLYRKADEWWHGELNGNVGFFPATYVEEIFT